MFGLDRRFCILSGYYGAQRVDPGNVGLLRLWLDKLFERADVSLLFLRDRLHLSSDLPDLGFQHLLLRLELHLI